MAVDKSVFEFEWDKGNIDKNKKHNVRNQEAEEPFLDRQKLIMDDEGHSLTEKRYLLLGQTKNGRRLSIIFTKRGTKIRVISARDMSKKERRKYEEESENNS